MTRTQHREKLYDRPISRPLSRPVLDWNELMPGDKVVIVDRRGNVIPAAVDTLSDHGTMVWLKPEYLGQNTLHHRTLYLRSDPIMLHWIG